MKMKMKMKISILKYFFTIFSFPFKDDHSRVILSYIENIPGSDYINANFIDVSSIYDS